MNAVIRTNLPEMTGELEILRACQWMGCEHESLGAPIVATHRGHRKIPSIKTGFCAELDCSFFANKVSRGFDFC
jgi:hypothetical protein